MVDVACAVHVHSLYSDGTGTIPEIAAAARRAGARAVLITDHDSTDGRHEAGWVDGVLVCVGVEVSPRRGSHLLCFGLDEPPAHLARSTAQVIDHVHAQGGFCIAAHPMSRGGWLMGVAGRAAPWGDLRLPFDGMEVWSMVTDVLEHVHGPRQLWRFRRDPDSVVVEPPRRNLAAWDALARHRRIAAIAGLDAHQYGIRIGTGPALVAMRYETSFRLLRTHVLLDAPMSGDARADTVAIYAALREGRSYMARDSLADATGFSFASDGRQIAVRTPRAAKLCLRGNGQVVCEGHGTKLNHQALCGGAYRVEAKLPRNGRWHTWVLSNHVWLD